MELDLSGKTALITGAGRGIGEEITHTFAEAGADIVAAARTESEIRDTVETVESAYGVTGLAVPTDLRDTAEIEALVERTVEAFGQSEILVNNAALNLTNPPEQQTLEEVDAMITHGGANSVREAVAAAVPLLVSPVCNDQPIQAYFARRRGVGVALPGLEPLARRLGERHEEDVHVVGSLHLEQVHAGRFVALAVLTRLEQHVRRGPRPAWRVSVHL